MSRDADYLEEAAFCWEQREAAVGCAPNVSLGELADVDEQLAAQIDGWITDSAASERQDLSCAHNDAASLFVVAVGIAGTLNAAPAEIWHRNATDERRRALGSALGWLPWKTVRSLENAGAFKGPDGVWLTTQAAATHRRSFDTTLTPAFDHKDVGVRALACRAASCLGRVDLLPLLCEMLASDRSALVTVQATLARVLLGKRDVGSALTCDPKRLPRPLKEELVQLRLLALPPDEAYEALRLLEASRSAERLRVKGVGWAGDPRYSPWLIDQMSNPAVARIAAEAFVHITGADFNPDQLEAMPPDDFEEGPNDDPDDDDVELPEDIALPWPDVERIKAWWMAHRGEFTPGQKLFLGKPITPEHCVHVLKTGYQRQRVIAAHYRTLIQPGTVLFPTSAPAWRQQRLLATL